jgi:hypothetical protein
MPRHYGDAPVSTDIYGLIEVPDPAFDQQSTPASKTAYASPKTPAFPVPVAFVDGQPSLVRCGHRCRRPAVLPTSIRPGRHQPGHSRTKEPALPGIAHTGPADPHPPLSLAASAPDLALGNRSGHSVRTYPPPTTASHLTSRTPIPPTRRPTPTGATAGLGTCPDINFIHNG